MSTAELKRLIDERTSEERLWMTAYLLDEMRAAPELKQTAAELTELAQRRADLNEGRHRVTQAEAEVSWAGSDEGE